MRQPLCITATNFRAPLSQRWAMHYPHLCHNGPRQPVVGATGDFQERDDDGAGVDDDRIGAAALGDRRRAANAHAGGERVGGAAERLDSGGLRELGRDQSRPIAFSMTRRLRPTRSWPPMWPRPPTASPPRTTDWCWRCRTPPSLSCSAHPALDGAGPLAGAGQRGLLVHSVLAATDDGVPLGLLHQHRWARDPEEPGSRHTRRRKPTVEKESQRWLDALRATHAARSAGTAVLTVADREADLYDLFAPAPPGRQRAVNPRHPQSAGRA